jgi:GntR family transcriptional regulator
VILRVDLHSPIPPYEQLREQLAGLITSGSMAAGDRLPTIRQLAGDLGVASGTVARAYRELESAGLVASRGRHGTRVADVTAIQTPVAVRRAARRFVAEARALGVTLPDAVHAVRAAYALEGDS